MKHQIEHLRKTRAYLTDILGSLTPEQINTVPDGFANNVIWNFAHLIAAQQGICYRRAGQPLVIDEVFFEAYKPGTRPQDTVSADEIERIKALSATTLDRFEEDYEKGMFANYPEWTTRYGVSLASIDDAMRFIHYHEGLHTGFIMALKRALVQQPVAPRSLRLHSWIIHYCPIKSSRLYIGSFLESRRLAGAVLPSQYVREDQRRHNSRIALHDKLRRVYIQLAPGDFLIGHRTGIRAVRSSRV
jgi:hypothetical protein